MTITIHRGINQIGGCITEIASASGTKILIDLVTGNEIALQQAIFVKVKMDD